MKKIISILIICLIYMQSIHAYNLNFNYINLNEETINISNYDGEILLIDVMAIWCKPCLEEIKELVNVTRLRPQMKILSISIDPINDLPDLLADYVNRNGILWDVGIDVNEVVMNLFDVREIPTLLFIDETGKLLKKWIGITPYNETITYYDQLMEDQSFDRQYKLFIAVIQPYLPFIYLIMIIIVILISSYIKNKYFVK